MRGIYQSYSEEMENKNFFKQSRKMKKSWYDGTTGLPPLDYAINNAVNYGWSHHIERLMILANLMNLCEIKPTIVYKWFMEMFVDSSDWVMVPNVYGMGLFSDGGIFATKPYICGFVTGVDRWTSKSACPCLSGLTRLRNQPGLQLLITTSITYFPLLNTRQPIDESVFE